MDTAVIATADSQLRESLLRMCAATGVTPEVADAPGDLARGWSRADAVVIGPDAVRAVLDQRLPRRTGVLLVGADDRRWREGVAVGAQDVFVLPDDDARLVDALARAVDGGREACVVSVVGGTGGSWASTIAAGIGLAGARRGLASILVDADPWGGGADLVLGSEQVAGLRWPQIDSAAGRLATGSLADVVPARDGLATVSWTREVPDDRAIAPLVTAAAGDFDLVVVDLPRQGGAAVDEVIARSVLAVVTIPCDVRGIAASRLVIERLGAAGSVVGIACGGPGIHTSTAAAFVDLPIVAAVRRDRRLAAAIDGGRGPGQSRMIRRAADAVLDLVGLR